ncbi:hypothetical protein HHI36_022973 [Cryptolaemus montrouzieri]|uniref:Kinesin-like protein n=1 Tax=Cryptolaemus montrouzieri TaxID=559131 RepID=A0ABD2PFK1_9CUCU
MKMGTANRTTGETQMNISSSRSHSIFRIVIESTINSDDVDNPVQVSHLNLIDLAGSERVSQTGATGQRFKEGAHINKSLTVLGLVIRQLVDKKDHISYRDSKLTRILSNSLGGNAKTIIICNINMESIEDTISTLMFAQRAKAIKNKPKVNEILTETSLTKKYARECSEINKLLKTELEKNKQLEDEREMSSKKITDLCSRIQSLEEMFVRKGVVKKLPKRRHTFCATLNTISEERDTESLRGLEDFTCDSSRFALEDDSVILIDTGQSNNSNLGTLETSRFRLPEDTPEKNLRQRLICTTREYEELLEFLRLEEANKLSVEKEMTSKIKDLTEECKDLRIYRERVKTENRKLTQEVEQMKNDYDFIIETQKKKFEKREKELIEELNRSSKKTPTFQVSTFEFEELTEKIQSLEKQNEELHKTIEKLKSQNEKLNMACESFELENEDLNSKISSLEEKHVQSQIENKALETKCSDLESKIVLVESKYDTTLVDPLKKEISELQSNILKIQSELTEVQKELFDSQDKLIQTVQDLDLEEKKSLKLKQELDEEKKLREETERKLEESKQSPHLFRRFSSDSSINQQCKSLDGEVLQMLHKLKYILEMKPKQNEPAISSEAKSSEEITKTDECLDSTYPHETSEDMLDVDLEKIESFSTDYFQDCDKSERYMDFISSFISQRSYLSIQEATGETDNNKSNKPETDLSHELAQLKIEISQLKKNKNVIRLQLCNCKNN